MENIQKIINKVGPPVSGKNFFGRKKELDYVWEMLQKGNNYKFPSPR